MESELFATTREYDGAEDDRAEDDGAEDNGAEDDGAEDAMAYVHVNVYVICPICLVLLHRPHSLDPCLHLFCDPCLRRLNEASFDTCPICRVLITDCHLDEELHNFIENQHQNVYIQRQQVEMISGIFNEPLPPTEDDSAEDSEYFFFSGFLFPLLILYFGAKCYVVIVEFLMHICYGIFFRH